MAINPARSAKPLRLVEPGPQDATTASPRKRPAFTGRQAELAKLVAAFNSAAGGEAAIVLVGGEAGIGKSRLIEQLMGLARERGALSATGGCAPVAGGLPYGPIVALFRDLVRQSEDPAAAALLDRLTHDDTNGVASRGAKQTGAGANRTLDGLAKTRLFESVLSCVAQLAAEQPLVLEVEDLHWADSATAELIDFLARNLTTEQVLIVGTYRVEELGREHPLRPWLIELGRNPRVSQLRLTGLERTEVAALIADLIGAPGDWSLVEAVWSRSQGNPFYVEELTTARDSATLPAELRDLVINRLESLPLATQKVVGFAAVAGAEVDHGLLAALSGLDARALDIALVEATDNQILLIDGNTGYRFRHALLLEAVYESLLPGERRRLHREIAMLIESDLSIGPSNADRRVAEVAAQWWAAGDWARALLPSIAAADSAAAMLAYPEAHLHLEHALEALQRIPNADVDQPGLIEKAANIAYHADAPSRALELAEQAVACSDPTADPETAVRRLLLLARAANTDSDLAFDCYRRCLAILPADRPSEQLAEVMAAQAGRLMVGFQMRAGEQRSLEALEVARVVGARETEGLALNYLGCCRAGSGHLDEGLDLLRESLVIGEELVDPCSLTTAYTNLSSTLMDGGRLEEAASLVFDMSAVGEDLWGVKLSGAAGNGVEALIRLGRYAEARALLAEIRRGVQGICAPAPFRLPSYIEIRTGAFDEAHRLLAIYDEMTAGATDVDQRGTYYRVCMELALEEGRPADAYDYAQQALALTAGTDDEVLMAEVLGLAARSVADRLEDARQRGLSFDAEQAELLADHQATAMAGLLARYTGDARPMPRTLAYAATLDAERSRLHRSDPAAWATAVRLWELAHEPYPLAYCQWRQAEALLEGRTRRGDAVSALEQAWSIARTLDAAPLLGRIERLAQRARIELRASALDDDRESRVAKDLGLTPREVEVLGQLAIGRTDKEIGESLFISKKTASVHVSNLLRKLDVANRVEAGRVAQARGLSDR